MISYRRIGTTQENLPEISEIPSPEVLDEVMQNERLINEARAERDKLIHELHIIICKPELFSVSEGGTNILRFENVAEATSDNDKRKTIIIDSRNSPKLLFDEINKVFNISEIDAKSLVLTSLSCEMGERNIRAISTIKVDSSLEPNANLETIGIRNGTMLLIWNGKDIAPNKTWDSTKSPITLHLKITTKGGADDYIEVFEDSPLSTIIEACSAISGINSDSIQFEIGGKILDPSLKISELKLRHLSRVFVSRSPKSIQQNETPIAKVETSNVEGMLTIFASVTYSNEPIPSICVHISKHASVADLKAMILAQIPNPPKEHTVDICRTQTGGVEGKRFENLGSSLDDSGVQDCQRVCIAKADPDAIPFYVPNGVKAGSDSISVTLIHMLEKEAMTFEIALPRHSSISECKLMISPLVNLDPSEMRIRRIDFFDLPGEYLNDEQKEVQKYHIRVGDRLFIEKGKAPSPGSIILTVLLLGATSDSQDSTVTSKIAALGNCSPVLYISHNSDCSLPPNTIQLEDLEVNASVTLSDLRALILPHLPLNECSPDRIRIWHHNKLLRKDDTTLRQLHLVEDSVISIQILPAPDKLLALGNGLLLFFHKRNIAQDIFEPAEEIIVEPATIQELYENVSKVTEIPKEFLRLVHYNPGTYSWRPLDISAPEKKPQKKQNQQQPDKTTEGKGNQKKVILLTQKPFNLKDGETISAADLRETPDAANERYIFSDWPPLLRLRSESGVPLEDFAPKNNRVRRPEPKLVIKGYAHKQHEEQQKLKQSTSPSTSTSSTPENSQQ